jgi:acetyltransferase-like isoleucine patch superfamily enzyme
MIHALKKAIKDPCKARRVIFALMRGWRIKLIYRLIKPDVHIGKNFRAYNSIKIHGPGRVIIGDRVNTHQTAFKKLTIITHLSDSLVTIGDGTDLGGVQISCVTKVEIGKENLIANSYFIDSDIIPYPNAKIDREWKEKYSAPIIVGNRAWIGSNSIILKGVAIGDECVVSAGSVVNKSADQCSILMGNPARKIGSTRNTESTKTMGSTGAMGSTGL